MDLKALLFLELTDAEVDASAQEMDPDAVIAALGHEGEFYHGIAIDPQIVLAAEADFRPAPLALELIAFDYGQVGDGRFRPEISGPIEDDVTLDIGHPDKASAVVLLVLGEGEEAQESHCPNQQDCLFHLLSPYQHPYYSNPRAKSPCLEIRQKWPFYVLYSGQMISRVVSVRVLSPRTTERAHVILPR